MTNINHTQIIGIHGLIGAGKDTLASFMIDYLQRRGLKCGRLGFADALKIELARALLYLDDLNDSIDEYGGDTADKLIEEKVKYINDNKRHFRLILQGWGTDFRRQLIHNDYWINKWQQRLNYMQTAGYHIVLCPDVRFANEFMKIKSLLGVCIEIIRPSLLDYPASSHDSEQGFGGVNFDHVLTNSGTLDDLKAKAETLCLALGYI